MAISGIAHNDAANSEALRAYSPPDRTPSPPPRRDDDRPDERVQAIKDTRAALPAGQGARIDMIA